MPNRRQHKALGTFAGGGGAFLVGRDLPGDALAVITAAGALGGYAGGQIPDILEPAVHSWHRGAFHSVLAGGAATTGVLSLANSGKAEVLERASRLRLEREALSPEDPRRITLWLAEMGLYAVLGIAIGICAGYASHIVADMCTPRGVPLVSRNSV